MVSRAKNLIGKTFGRLKVEKRVENDHKRAMWLCLCKCGKYKVVSTTYLVRGDVKSCGCLAEEVRKKGNPKHNLYHTRIYKIWSSIKNRCYLKSHKAYQRYGGRGIKMCKEWFDSVEVFYKWAISNGYNCTLSIDRIDNNGDYEPSNCKWSTPIQQQNNTSKNVIFTYKGEKLTLSEISRKYNINYSTLYNRIKKSNDIVKVIETPIDKSKSRNSPKH